MKDFKRNERAGIVKGRLVVVSNQSLDCLFDDNDDDYETNNFLVSHIAVCAED